MMSGEYASYYSGEFFLDTSQLESYKFMRSHLSKEEIFKIYEEEMKKKKIVNMERFIGDTPEEVLELISNYYIKSFNWEGTKYNKF